MSREVVVPPGGCCGAWRRRGGDGAGGPWGGSSGPAARGTCPGLQEQRLILPEPGVLQTLLLSKHWHSSGLEWGQLLRMPFMGQLPMAGSEGGGGAHVGVEWSSRIGDTLREIWGAAASFVRHKGIYGGGDRAETQGPVRGCFVGENIRLVEIFSSH